VTALDEVAEVVPRRADTSGLLQLTHAVRVALEASDQARLTEAMASWEVALPDWRTSAAAHAAAAESQKACAAVRRHVLARAAAAGLVSDG